MIARTMPRYLYRVISASSPVPRVWLQLPLRPTSRRLYSTSKTEPGPMAQFYRTFSRPIAKVLLLAIFTYQLAYFFWVRLEQDEIKSDVEATISDLENRIAELEKTKKR